ncbi:hypothetical protein Tco_1237827 [Tanacetum coccineum]
MFRYLQRIHKVAAKIAYIRSFEDFEALQLSNHCNQSMLEEKDGIFDVVHMLTRRHMLEAVSHSKKTCSLVSMAALHVEQAMEGISIPPKGGGDCQYEISWLELRTNRHLKSSMTKESGALLKETCPIFEINLSRAAMLRLPILDRFQFQFHVLLTNRSARTQFSFESK